MYVEDEVLRNWLQLMNDCGIENLTSGEHEYLDANVKYVEEFVIEGEEPNARWVRESRDHWVAYYQVKRSQHPFFKTA
jgi:hypothetical protein